MPRRWPPPDAHPVRVARVRTPIQRIDLERIEPGIHALFLDDAIQFVEGPDDEAYHRTLADEPLERLERALLGGPVDVLILGGGDGLAARNLLRRPEVRSVTLVEIDAGMVAFCARHPVMRRLNGGAFRDPRLRVICEDARAFLARPPRRLYDVGIVDFPDPTPALLGLYEPAVYARLLRHLKPRAVIAVQASSAYSPVEDHVAGILERLTGRPVERLHFRGLYMDPGAIVVGEKGAARGREADLLGLGGLV